MQRWFRPRRRGRLLVRESGGLIRQLLERLLKLGWLESKGAGLAFVEHPVVLIDQVDALGPSGVRLFG